MSSLHQSLRSVFVIALLLLDARVALSQSESSLSRSREQFEQESARAKAKLKSEFDTVADRLSKSKNSADRKVALLDVLKVEKEDFEKSGMVPWSAPMLPYTEAYLLSLFKAQNKVIQTYAAEIDKLLRRREDSKANTLRAELKSVLGIEIIARWNHQPGNNAPREIALYSNGRIGSTDDKSTWSIEGGRLVLRWPNPSAPGGTWVDSCAVGADGLSYSGTNQKRTQIGGTRLKR